MPRAALSDVVKNVRLFHKLNTKRKALEKLEDAVKVFFKVEAGGADARFIDEKGKLEVVVSHEPQTRVDLQKLRLELGPKIEAYETSSTVEKVIVKEFKAEKAKRSGT